MNSIENILHCSMEQLREMADVNLIVGTPLALGDENMILPVSRVCVGFVSGGGEYDCKTQPVHAAAQEAEPKLAGGTAAGICISPVAFLSVCGGNARVLPTRVNSSLDRLIDALCPLANELISKCPCSSPKSEKNDDCGCKHSYQR